MSSPLPDDIQDFFTLLKKIEEAIDDIARLEEMLDQGHTLTSEESAKLENAKRAVRNARNVIAGVVGSEDGLKIAGRLTKGQKSGVARVLSKLGLSGIGKAFGQTASKAGNLLGKLCGGVLKGAGRLVAGIPGAVLDILLDPKPTGGAWEEREVDRMMIKIDGVCYEIIYLQGKSEDELLWSDVYTRTTEAVPCPDASKKQAALSKELRALEIQSFRSMTPAMASVSEELNLLQSNYESEETLPNAEQIMALRAAAYDLCGSIDSWLQTSRARAQVSARNERVR